MSKPKILPAVLFLLLGCNVIADAQQDRAAWMKQSRWGVMTHYLADWIARTHNLRMSGAEWNKLVNNFDAEGIAKQLQSVGAGYYQISIGQNSG
jgi:hypothetical protein